MIGLNDAARYIGLTPQYVSTLFKKEMGVGFSEYVSSMRLQKVCQQLKETDLTVTQISKEAGFPDYQYFCKIFKKRYGCSPSAYRIG